MSAWYDEDDGRPAERMDWRLWKRLLGYSLRYRRWTAILLVQAVATGAIDASFHLVTRNVVDASVATDAGADRRLFLWLAVYGVLAVALACCVRVFVRYGGRVRAHVARDIRADAFENLQRLSQAYFDQRPVGWLMARMTSDCERLSMALSWGALDIAWGLATMGVASVAMLYMDWRLGLIGLGVIPPLWLVSLWFQRRIIGTARQVRGLNSRLTASFNETLAGVRTVRAFGAQDRFQGEFESLSERMRERSVRNAVLSAMYLPAVLGLAGIAVGLCLGFGGVRVVAGTITIGTLIAFLGYSRQFFEPLQEMAAWFCEFQMAQASAERVFGLVDERPNVLDTPAAERRLAAQARAPRPGVAPDGLPDRIGDIELRGVRFAYGEGVDVLRDVDLVVPEGSTVALVGPTGGGKTTLVNLVCRFHEPTAGAVLAGGVEYRERSLRWWYGRLGVVLQEPHLFSGTIADNIRYGRPDATLDEVVDAARTAQADAFVRKLEQGYDTEVGAGGSQLSMGQRQLVSLARALLVRPQLLVMDEATSSVDTETERLLQEGVQRALRGRTAFVIAHRLSTIRAADLICVVEDGRITESGTHTELVARRGRYADLDALAH